MSEQNQIRKSNISENDINLSKGKIEKMSSPQITNPITDQIVPPGNPIHLTANSIINGTDISHKLGSSDIILAANQTYLAILELEINNFTFYEIGFRLNNNLLPQKGTQVISSRDNISPSLLSTSTTFSTPTGSPSILQIFNLSYKPINISGVTFSIIKIT
ncbi:hypothetical protein [Priestia endophytica]|uniref:Uncharacterized protein n=1 Tax=Priestia endophytica TaxID=135735 RepID=A0AAX1QBD3_9BACI|nr:hypothetical protein [Priestia endophytica]RAS78205.1 hypothetical protein A3864_09175 [Priestia endophytica]